MNPAIESTFHKIHATYIEPAELPESDGLSTGKLGLALYYLNLYISDGDTASGIMAQEYLNVVFENLGKQTNLAGASLGNGLAGLGFVTNLFKKHQLIELNFEEDFGSLDEYIYSTAITEIENRNLDFLRDASGMIHYFLCRPDSPKINTYCTDLLHRILQLAEEDNYFQMRDKPILGGDVPIDNLRIHDSLPQLLLLLIKAIEQGIMVENGRETLQKGCDFILSHRGDSEKSGANLDHISLHVNAGNTMSTVDDRMGWWHRELTFVWLLYKVAAFLADEKLMNMADKIGLDITSALVNEQTTVEDLNFCHGSAGLLQFYLSLFNETGREMYKTAHEYWLDKTLTLVDETIENKTFEGKEASLYSGWLGVNLTLLSVISEKPLNWQTVFLV